MATHKPSGTLCSAMAIAKATPKVGEDKAATNVAIPSGKLCRAMAKAEIKTTSE